MAYGVMLLVWMLTEYQKLESDGPVAVMTTTVPASLIGIGGYNLLLLLLLLMLMHRVNMLAPPYTRSQKHYRTHKSRTHSTQHSSPGLFQTKAPHTASLALFNILNKQVRDERTSRERLKRREERRNKTTSVSSPIC